MRRIALATAFLAIPAICFAQAPQRATAGQRNWVSVDAPVVALTHVQVVDGTGAAPMADQTVIISGDKITWVGPSAGAQVPDNAKVLDLAGHTVIPGIVGLHDHTFYTTNNRSIQMNVTGPRLYLASGVTTVRTTGSSSPYSEINLKRNIERGISVGPRMYITGPYLTGETGSSHMLQLLTPEAARRTVDYWAEEGASWLKFYTTPSRAVMGAAIEEAHKKGLKVTGHLCSVSFREAVALGIDNLEHGLFVNTDYDPAKQPDQCPSDAMTKLASLDLASPQVQSTLREMNQHHVAMTSTLAIYEAFVPNRPPLEQRVLDMMSAETRAEYLTARARLAEPGAFSISPEIFRKAQDFDLAFVRSGGLLAAGVDPTGNGGALPGFGDQRNYELLIEAGFKPVEAIQIMTQNGARVLGADQQYGSIAVGKSADLVVIRGDPIARPAEIRNVVTVFKEGLGYDSAKLIESVRGQVGIR
jgi:imidazolonepropionase-like amidohydrolase